MSSSRCVWLGLCLVIAIFPSFGNTAPESPDDEDAELKKLLAEWKRMEKQGLPRVGRDPKPLVLHHLKRADLLEKIVSKVKPAERDRWVRQLADTLSATSQLDFKNDTSATDRLAKLAKRLTETLPRCHPLTAYATYRAMQADYTHSLPPYGKEKDFEKVQQAWLKRLRQFVKDFPHSEDTPDALLQAGMVSEFLNHDSGAKKWYARLKHDFADKPQAAKAKGAIRRLELEGRVLKLAGPLLKEPKTRFNINHLRKKVVIVYYWASWNSQCKDNFTRLKRLLDRYNTKELALVCVNLDGTAEEARKYLDNAPAPGTHLHQDGGLEGKLALDYGIMIVPSIFLVGREGKVIRRDLSILSLEDEIEKLHLNRRR